jgi:excisionase family DNA binding protein
MPFGAAMNNQNPDETQSVPIEWITTAEAAAILGVSPAVVRRRLKEGDLPGVVAGGDWRLPRGAIVSLAGPSDAEEAMNEPEKEELAVVEDIANVRLGDLPLLLSPEQVAIVLRIPLSTVRGMLRRGELPSVQVGRSRRVPSPALVRWLARTEAA